MADLIGDPIADGEATSGSINPLRVTHVVLSLDCGGLERVVLDLARMAPGLGQRVSVICLERRGTLAPRVEAAGARVLCLDKPPGRRPEMVGKIRQALRQLDPDVVHTHQIGALFYTGPAARGERCPFVVHTEHQNQLARSSALAHQLRAHLLWKLAGRRADLIFCVSQDTAGAVRSLAAVPGRRIRVVLNGIDTSRFLDRGAGLALRRELGIASTSRVIGTVGRLSEVKCQDLLIQSFGKVHAHAPDSYLLLVGDGPKRTDLIALTAALGLTGRVLFAGYQAEPERYLQAMDLFALTSHSEGLPLAVLEAWAAGLPVVATRVGGIPKLITDGRDGRLIDPGDEPALTSTLLQLLTDRAQARSLGAEGRLRAILDFDIQRMARDYHRHYLELLTPERMSDRCAS